MKFFYELSLIILTLHSTLLSAEELPPLPPSLEESLTVPLGDLKLKKLYFKTGSNELKDDDKAYISDIFYKIKDMTLYVVIKAYTDSVGDAEKNLNLSRNRATAVKDVVRNAVGWSENHFLVFGYGEQFAKAGADESERRVEITLLVPKKESVNLENMRQEIKAKGVNVEDYLAVAEEKQNGPTLKNELAPLEQKRKLYGTFGILFGGGKNSENKTGFSRNAFQLGLRYEYSDTYHLQVSLQSTNSTFKKEATYYVTGNTLAVSIYYVKHLHKVVAWINGLGFINQIQEIKKKTDPAMIDFRQNESGIQANAKGVQYECLFEFYPPRYFLQPTIGLNFQFLPKSFYMGPTIGFRF